MATMRNAIMLTDKMTPVFNKMATAMVSNLKLMKQMNSASKAGIDSKAFNQAEKDINAANNAVLMFKSNLSMTQQAASGVKNAFSGMKNQLMNIYAGTQLVRQGWEALKGGASYLDGLSSMKARANLVNDGSQTTPELQDKMAAAALRSRADYNAFSSSAIKMNLLAPDAFKGNDDAIAFMETLNKMFVISGTSAEEATAAQYQLTQAMASGRLQGDEFRSIIENAPMLKNALMDSLGVGSAELKQMSTNGELTAEVIKNAMYDATDSVNQQFASMPMTFGQVATNLKTIMARAMQRVSDAFSELINSDTGKNIFNGLVIGITVFANTLKVLMKVSQNTLGFIGAGWVAIGPILIGLLAGLAFHFIEMGVSASIAGMKSVASAIKTGVAWMFAHSQLMLVIAATGLAVYALNNLGDVGQYVAIVIMSLVAAYAAWQVAQWALNSAMAACPITWILVAIIAIIIVIFMIIDAMNNLTGSSISAVGVIAGVFATVGSLVWNIFVGLYNMILEVMASFWNILIDFGNFFANFLNDPIAAVVHLIADLVTSALGLLKGLAEVMDAIFGSNLADAVAGWQNNVQSWATDLVGEQEITFKKFDASAYKLDRLDYGEAYNAGYNFGENLQSSFSGFDPNSIMNQTSEAMSGLGGLNDALSANPDGGRLDSVGKINDDVSIADEDIKLLKDIATTKFVNKYTTLQPNMTVSFGDVYESGDIDKNKIMQVVEDMASEAFAVAVVQEAH